MGSELSRGSQRRARRAQRKAMRQRQNEYWFWAVIFIILLFGFDLLFGRILGLYVHTQSACAEMAAGVLTDLNGVTLQKWGYGFAFTLFGLWAIIGIIYFDVLKTGRRKWRVSAHMVGFLAIFCFASTMKLLSSDAGSVPDGYLYTSSYAAIINDNSGKIIRYENLDGIRPYSSPYVWKIKGELTQDDIEYNAAIPRCAWRKEKTVADATFPMTESQLDEIKEIGRHGYVAPHLDSGPLAMSILWSWIWTEKLGYTTLQSYNHYRPMTPEEIMRFDEKQICIAKANKASQPVWGCDWVRVFVIDEDGRIAQ